MATQGDPTRETGASRAGSDPARILIVRPSALGDVCRSVPVAASLRAAWPDATIDWLVQDAFRDAVVAHPAVDRVIDFPRRRFARPWRPSVARELLGWLRGLRRPRYDLVVDAQGLGRSGAISRATGARRRIGWADAREGAWIAYTDRVRSDPAAHAIDRMLDLVEAAGAPRVEDLRLVVPDASRETFRDLASEVGLDEAGAWAVCAPTARWRCKQWPAERWHEVARWLHARGLRPVFVGAPSERAAVAAAIPDDVPAIDLSGRTSVGVLMAVISGSRLAIAGDSAALHMAMGLGRASVALFGPTEPSLVGPRGAPHVVLRHHDPATDGVVHYRRAPDDDTLMRRITVDEVTAAAGELMHGAGDDRDDGTAAARSAGDSDRPHDAGDAGTPADASTPWRGTDVTPAGGTSP